MRYWQRLTLVLTLVPLLNIVEYAVLSQNQNDGLYPVNGDSIGLPLMTTLLLSLMLVPYLSLIVGLTSFRRLLSFSERGPAAFVTVLGLLIVAYIPGLILLLAVAARWYAPSHYSILGVAVALLVVLAVCFVVDIQRMVSKRAFNASKEG
jgi:hypothetical protein